MPKISVKYQSDLLVKMISTLDYTIVHALTSDDLAIRLLERQYNLERSEAQALVKTLRTNLGVTQMGFGKVEIRSYTEKLLELDTAVYDHVHYLYSLEIPLKVPAIKLIRGLSGFTLREAKEIADWIGDHPRV